MAPTASAPGVPASMRRWRRVPVPARRALVTARRLSHFTSRPHPKFDVDVIEGVAVVTADDGKVNAISGPMSRAFTRALDRVEADERVRAVVLTGRPGQFSAGFDLDTLIVGGRARDELVRDGWGLILRLFTLPLPVVAACTGNAVAAGAALLLTADARLGADGDFKIGFNEAAIGLPLPGVVLMLAAERLSEDAYEEATHGARMYRPREALTAGFLDRVVPAAELVDAAIDEADALSSLPAGTFRRDKEARVGLIAERMRQQLPDDLRLIERIGA